MVCKKSLYCWKNGPCASDETRKKIWEDNIRFRVNLRELNQSDHYWSFQVTKNVCLCLEGEEPSCDRSFSGKYRSSSLQKLHQIDCTSVTHDYNGLKLRNCFLHCPIQNIKRNTEDKRCGTPIPEPLIRKDAVTLENPTTFWKKAEQKVGKCFKNKNVPATIKQSNLASAAESKNLLKLKSFHASLDNIFFKPEEAEFMTDKIKDPNDEILQKKTNDNLKLYQKLTKNKNLSKKATTKSYLNPSQTLKIAREGNQRYKMKKVLFSNHNIGISNNNNNDVSKKFGSGQNATPARMEKKKVLQSYVDRKENDKCISDIGNKKQINHSSLWSTDKARKQCQSSTENTGKYILPPVNKPPKKYSESTTTKTLFFKKSCKPQIKFYS